MGKVLLTDEQKEQLKASEIKEIKKEQDAYGCLGAVSIGTMFLLALSAIAMFLWMNKLTIFIMSGMGLLNLIIVFLAYIQFKTYIGTIKKAKARIENQ